MSQFPPQCQAKPDWYLEDPFRAVYLGLGLGAVAMILRATLDGGVFTFLRLAVMVVSVLAAGAAVWWRLGTADANDFEEQSKTGILVALASGCVLAAYVALPADADSMQMAALVLWILTLVSVPVILLPSIARRVAISLWIIFHFGGVFTATTAVQLPNNAPLPWLPTVVWNHVYKNYLTFTYMNNAYHFYSPEPGPPTLVWFQVIFEDGSTHWHRIVRREDYPTRQQYQRFLSLTESTNQPNMVSPSKFNILLRRRIKYTWPAPPQKVGSKQPTPTFPMPEAVPAVNQYREPNELARKYLQSYAAYVCRTTKSTKNPDLKVKSVRIYRLTHELIRADQMASGVSPTDPTLFWAFFYGEYDYKPKNRDKNPPEPIAVLKGSPYVEEDDPPTVVKGKMRWTEPMPNGTQRPWEEEVRDPLLYWLLPIYRVPKPGKDGSANLDDYELRDCLSAHSGDQIPWDK